VNDLEYKLNSQLTRQKEIEKEVESLVSSWMFLSTKCVRNRLV
jgi:hypothetical protein